MRTSRVSRDTARLVEALRQQPTPLPSSPQQQQQQQQQQQRVRPTTRSSSRTLTKGMSSISTNSSSTATTTATTGKKPSKQNNQDHHLKAVRAEQQHGEQVDKLRAARGRRAENVPDIEDTASQSDVRSPAALERKRKRRSIVVDKHDEIYTGNANGGVAEAKQQSPQRLRRPKRAPARQDVDADSGNVIQTTAPPGWEQMYELTAQMRKLNPAPVDTMGCETLAQAGLSDRDRRFQTLIALMLSSQTKDTVTAMTMHRLQTELPPPAGLSLEGILAVEPDTLNELIWAVGFHNNKTKFIKKTAEVLRDQFDGDIPDTIEGMISLPGVGPKMAYLCMSSAWGRDEGIGVDVHVHRITNLWGWHKTKTPEETRAMLESWLPKDKWHDINHLLVGFGQTICAPIGRKCYNCTLSSEGLCPSAVVDRKIRTAKVQVKSEGDELVKKTVVKEEDITADGSSVKLEAVASP